MLDARMRLTRAEDFRDVTRTGTRVKTSAFVLHLTVPPSGSAHPCARAGLVVATSVGGSVVRHQVSRRLRHQLREPLRALPAGSRVVVRALPAAAQASSATLGTAMTVAMRAAMESALRSAGSATGRSS